MLAQLLTQLRQQLAEIARECGHAALCCPHSGHRAKGE
jgi:hypothetical protein